MQETRCKNCSHKTISIFGKDYHWIMGHHGVKNCVATVIRNGKDESCGCSKAEPKLIDL